MILTYLSAAFLRGVLAINTFDSHSRYRVEASRCLIITRTVIAFPIIINLMLCDLASTPIRDMPIGAWEIVTLMSTKLKENLSYSRDISMYLEA